MATQAPIVDVAHVAQQVLSLNSTLDSVHIDLEKIGVMSGLELNPSIPPQRICDALASVKAKYDHVTFRMLYAIAKKAKRPDVVRDNRTHPGIKAAGDEVWFEVERTPASAIIRPYGKGGTSAMATVLIKSQGFQVWRSHIGFHVEAEPDQIVLFSSKFTGMKAGFIKQVIQSVCRPSLRT